MAVGKAMRRKGRNSVRKAIAERRKGRKALMYAKDRTHWGKFGDFNGMHMKFHTYLPIKGTLDDNLYEISNTLRNFLTLARY